MDNLAWYGTMFGLIAFFIEGLKPYGLHALRDFHPWLTKNYPTIIKALAFAIGVVVCALAKRDAFVDAEIYGLHPYAGYVLGGFFLANGNKAIDAVWNKRKDISALLNAFIANMYPKEAGNA